jgi:sortase B
MKLPIRKLLVGILALVCIGCIIRVVYQLVEYRRGDETYAQAEALVDLPDLSQLPTPLPTLPDVSASSSQASSSAPPAQEEVYVDPYADALRNMDFSALREVNDDILGWILIPDSKVSYPLVQGEDNDYYLNRTWRKTRNSVGAIFMECQNSGDLSDFNTIIYGHRMNNRSMFGTLIQYKDKNYWESHPYVYITDDNGSHRYEIFAAYEVSVEGDTYRLGFPDDGAKQRFLDFCVAQSVLDTGVIPTIYDRVLTLSTCTGNGHATRWVVQAVLKGEAPSDPAEPTAPAAPDASSPDASTPDTSSPASSSSSSAPDTSTASSSSAPDASGSDGSQNQAASPPEEEPPISQDIIRDGDEGRW